MAWLFNNGAQNSQPTRYAGLQVQTSVNGAPIKLLWGTNKLSGNLIDFVNFQSHEHKQSQGK